MARGRLAKIGMLRRPIRVKSTLPCRPPRRAVSRRAAPPAAPFPSPRRPARRAVPLAAPLLSLPWRFYTSRSLAWRFCTLKARAARNNATAMDPTCRNATAMDPTCRNAAAMEPACRNAAPRPLRVEIRVALHPAESVATLRHRYRHSIRLSVQFVATDCMANRRRSVSSRLGHLYVSKERQGPGRLGRRLSPTAAPAARACFVALGSLICVMWHMPTLRCQQATNA